MQVIKSVSDLPSWFKTAKYEKNLDAIQWYREIRKRAWFRLSFEMFRHTSTFNLDSARELFKICYTPIHKGSLVYKHVYDTHVRHSRPVESLSKEKLLFMAACLGDADSRQKYESYTELIEIFKNGIDGQGQPNLFESYDALIKPVITELSQNCNGKRSAVSEAIWHGGYPFYAWGIPLYGQVLSVNTDYDDKTIIKHVEEWLKQHRKDNATNAKRPFNQNDFDDWSYFKVREVFDLDTWAELHGIKIYDKVIAAVLWPHAPDEMSPIDVLRTTARRRVKEVFKFEVSTRFFDQLVLQFGADFLAKK